MLSPLLMTLSALAAAPATIVEHRVDVSIDSRRQLTETVQVTVRVDDPAACAAGVFVPPGLDGASSGGALVLEDLLVVPPDAVVGSVYTLKASRRGPRGSHSGVVRAAPDLPVEQATLTVSAPSYLPLTVWADPGATPTYAFSRRSRNVTMQWGEGSSPRAAWSTYPDWAAASKEVEDAVVGKLATKSALGRDVATDLEGLGVSGITERAFDRVALEGGPPGTWADARGALEVSKSRSGTAAERGVLLLSLLEIAGFEAKPALFRPADAGEGFPATVPAPALLTRPMVVVETSKGQVLVDPAADRASVPDRPASLLGATVWIPGQLPFALPDLGVVDGRVTILTDVTIAGDGSATWHASVGSTGAATEYLRELLAPLDEAGRSDAVGRLVGLGRPGMDRLQVKTSGVGGTDQPLKITVSGFDQQAMKVVDYGLIGTIAPTMAAGLAEWLPPNVQVTESMSIAPPPALTILGSSTDPSAFQPEALVSRHYRREGPRALLEVEVQRPYRDATPAQDSAARAFLGEQAPKGVEMLLFTAPSKATVNGLMASTMLTDAEKVILTAQLWWSAGNDKKAAKALKKGVARVGFASVLEGVSKRAQPGDLRPWSAMLELAGEEDTLRMAVASQMAKKGLFREAWLASAPLQKSTDASVSLSALLLAERIQGPKPGADDGEATGLWREPDALLADASAVAPTDARVLFRQAQRALEAGETTKAETILDGIQKSGEGSGAAAALGALAAAQSGIPRDEVVARIDEAVLMAPTDPEVIALAGLATAAVGAHHEALAFALTAARIAGDDPLMWDAAADRALAASDLGTAVYSARRASDLDATSVPRAKRLSALAQLLVDKEAYEVGLKRSGAQAEGAWPPTLDHRMRDAPPEALLGLLDVAEDEVAAEPRLLAMRAQMRIDMGRLDEGARDGLYLADRYAWPEGWALAYAGTAGRQYSSVLQDRLNDAANSQATAQATRMEVGLITGASDPLRDARELGDDLRATALRDAVADPKAAAAGVEGWPADLPTPSSSPPKGYRVNRALGASAGVVAYSNADAGLAVMRLGGITGLLPAPLHQLYSMNPQPLERLDGGGQVVRLDGGVIPLYAAIAFDGAEEVYGLGFSAEAAKRALRDALL